MQLEAPRSDEMLPARHGLGTVEPAMQKKPAGQASHCFWLRRPDEFDQEPGAHGIGSGLPGVLK